jgi:hypothetical protein
LLARKARRTYLTDPERYTLSSINRVGIGKICAIVGLILGSFFLFYSLIHYAFFGTLFEM